MIYLNKKDIEEIGINWFEVISVITDAASTIRNNNFAQPIKPYLRYNDLKNRIIAMPAFIGGNINFSGIKWIASFPDNIKRNIPRAHSVTILNDAFTGVPVCIVNTSIVSGIRTAAVSGAVVKKYLDCKDSAPKLNVGIVGFGPIGQLHLSMLTSLLKDRTSNIFIYDIREIDPEIVSDTPLKEKIKICSSWQEVYQNADIFITATVAQKPYINLPPKLGSLQLNVSLRDYLPEIGKKVDIMVVDEWEEVCRENTDIENMHKIIGLKKEDTYSLSEFLHNVTVESIKSDDIVMFNPMGMAVFDIAIGAYYYTQAQMKTVGTVLES